MNVLDSFSLKGKVALVTGGAGLFGRQIAEALAEAGAQTFMASRDVEKLEAQAKLFRERKLDVTALSLDQGREESIQSLMKQLSDRTPGVDVLINNAVLRPMKSWHESTETFARSMEVNATGIYVMTKVFGDHMAARERGSIVQVSSIQGTVGPDFSLYEGTTMGPPPPDYFFHKGGMLQLTRYAAAVYGPKGVRVNSITPGGFYTGQPDVFLKRYNQRTFLGRMANESDLKGVIVFLASEASAYITGANIPVDAGYTAK